MLTLVYICMYISTTHLESFVGKKKRLAAIGLFYGIRNRRKSSRGEGMEIYSLCYKTHPINQEILDSSGKEGRGACIVSA